jgi:hypothetical protein
MELLNESELLACFRSLDRDEVDTDALSFPLAVDGALAWSAGPRAFLLYREHAGRRPRGMVFHRSSAPLPDAASMCEWCHVVRPSGGVKLLTVRADDRRHVGLYLCSDLACVPHAIERIAQLANRRLF